ncbi:hypothetical protein [Actinomadura macrotermitis]|nr:hypothetical protein [Actinomadura macrotermitis]
MARAVGSAGSALSKYAVRAALGTPRRRALEGVYRQAIEHAVRKVAADEGTTDFDLQHAVGLLELMVGAAAEGDLPLLDSGVAADGTALSRWREIASEQGLDAGTFPLPFEKLIDHLLKGVAAEALHTAVDAEGNALFPAVAAAHLADLRHSMRTLTRTIVPDGRLRAALAAAYASCRDRDRMLHTPDVLLALMHLSDGSVTACFERVRTGLAGRVTGSLERFQAAPVDTFQPFDWVERPEMRQAQLYAWVHGAATVNGPLLLLGVLDTPSGTRDALLTALGDGVEPLRLAAISRIDPITPARTPGIFFEGLEDA